MFASDNPLLRLNLRIRPLLIIRHLTRHINGNGLRFKGAIPLLFSYWIEH
jgi:hypothetical protein